MYVSPKHSSESLFKIVNIRDWYSLTIHLKFVLSLKEIKQFKKKSTPDNYWIVSVVKPNVVNFTTTSPQHIEVYFYIILQVVSVLLFFNNFKQNDSLVKFWTKQHKCGPKYKHSDIERDMYHRIYLHKHRSDIQGSM